jgi:hypothetical protein
MALRVTGEMRPARYDLRANSPPRSERCSTSLQKPMQRGFMIM